MRRRYLAWGLGVFVAVAAIFVIAGRIAKSITEPRPPVKSVATDEMVVALTYDDGPEPHYTPKLLRILDRYGVKATFFMIGSRMEAYPEVVKEVMSGEHVIASHTYSHPRYLAREHTAQIASEIRKGERVVLKMTGRATHLYRPPRGLLGRESLRIADRMGYTTVLWSVAAYHHEAKTPELMARRVIDGARPGAIILMHDGRFPMRWKDVAATPLIIEGLRKKGYRFVTVPELLRIR